MTVDRAERLVAKGLNRYARALDERNWSLLDGVFAADAVARYGPDAPVHGREAIVRAIRFYLDRCGPTQHMITNVDVEEQDGAVISRSYVRAAHRAVAGEAILWSFAEYHARWMWRDADLLVSDWEMRVAFNHGDFSVFGR